jgi:hypothetical protein
MKVYEVEYRAVITLAAEDMQKAELYGAAVIKDNVHLFYARAVHERNVESVQRLLNPLGFAAGQLAVFQGASEGPTPEEQRIVRSHPSGPAKM